jgi:predicted AlkP superfamily phosphohydrolase/phosphomutase/tetratricopeptide (TPR) repeat protein
LRPTPDGVAELLALGRGTDPIARLDDAVDRLITERMADESDEWSIPRLDDALRHAVSGTLARYGTVQGEIVLTFSETSPLTAALREAEARETILSLQHDTGSRILLVGLDGADWQIADPLIERGLLPNLKRLRERGAWGNIKALTPILSPLLWTSVATGVTADRHGVLDFLIRDPSRGELVPVNSRFRKVRALWNLFSEAELSSDVVAWWATWPAEPVNGHLVSDRVAYSLFDFDLPTGSAGGTYPASYLEEIRPQLLNDDAITYADVARFAEVTREEFEAGRARIARDRKSAYREPVNHLSKILASTRSYHRIALDLIDRGQADLTAVYYQMIDEVCHRFMHFMPPRIEGVEADDIRRYGRAVEESYVYQDQLLGDLLDRVDPGTTVIVLSDHGFQNGADRPPGQTADIEGKPGRWHRPYGILVLSGPSIVKRELDTTSLLDVAPTVLYLAGLPVPEDTDGRVLEEAIRKEFHERFPLRRIPTYEVTPFRARTPPVAESVAAVEAEIVENLRALGYVGAGSTVAVEAGTQPELPAGNTGTETITAHTNLAAVLLASGRLERAEQEIQAALALNPAFAVARRQLFSVRVRQRRYEDAMALAENLLDEESQFDERFLARVADTYKTAGRTEEGIRRFTRSVENGQWQMGAPLARLLLESGNLTAADRTARAVVARDLRNRSAMVTIFRVARVRGELANLRPLLESALEQNPRSVMHLNWLAIVHESGGDVTRAERLLLRALEANPDHGGSMANLGAFYGRHGRNDEALVVLQRALRIAPGNVDARVNLGSALARLGRLDEAIVEFERVVAEGRRDTDIYNALARAHGQLGQLAAAAGWLRRSLELDPEQTEVRETLARLEGS